MRRNRKMGEERDQLETAEVRLARIGRMIGGECPKGCGFALIFFTMNTGTDGYASYVSNGQRPDMIKALRECADKLEKGDLI